jgi:hypothetical protein
MDVLYFDNVIASGRIRGDLKPPAEMAAVRSIEAAEKAGLVKITTARIAFEEQDRTKNLAVREQLKRERPGAAVVTDDHRVVGFHNQGDHTGGFISYPLVTDIVDEPLFLALKAAGLDDDLDARHLLYAIHNRCRWFVTLDHHFLDRKQQLEPLCRSLLIVRPSDLVAELLHPRAMDPPIGMAFSDRHGDRPEQAAGDSAVKIQNSVRKRRGRALGL